MYIGGRIMSNRNRNNKTTNGTTGNKAKAKNNVKKNIGYRNQRSTPTGAGSDDYTISEDRNVGRNDFSWYNRYPELIQASANIDYSLAQGVASEAMGQTLPGFVKYTVCTAIPTSLNAGDPINLSGTNTFIYINKGKSNNRPYDPVDLSRLLVATADLFAYIVWMQRIYGMSYMYSTQNRYMPEKMMTSMGVNYQNIIRNLPAFRAGINQLIRKAGALVLPSQEDVPFYARRAFLFQNIYIESECIKDQMYFLQPTGFYKYDPVDSGLKAVPFPYAHIKSGDAKDLATYEQLLEFGNSLLDSFFGDTDVATMCADIYNAYGAKCITLSLLQEDYAVAPLCNPEVLEQLMNADIYPIHLTDVVCKGDAAENPYLYYKPQVSLQLPDAEGSLVALNSWANSPLYTNSLKGDLEITTVNSRLKVAVGKWNHKSGTNVYTADVEGSGTEIVNGVYVYNGNDVMEITSNYIYLDTNKNDEYLWRRLKGLCSTTQCQYIPRLHLLIPDFVDSKKTVSIGLFGPVTNFGTLPKTTLVNLHRACAHSLFALPMTCVK